MSVTIGCGFKSGCSRLHSPDPNATFWVTVKRLLFPVQCKIR